MVLEELLRDTDTQLLRVQRFLELRESWDFDSADLVHRVNQNFVVRYPTLYRGARHAGQVLTDRLDRGRIASHIKRSRVMSLFKRGEIVATMALHDRSYLTECYASDVARLRNELGVDEAITWGFEASKTNGKPHAAMLAAAR